ncbi:MAG: ribonuclease HII [Clostridia bacterium]|nr:ribonuclease HII [Clostridia bacterium]
MEFIPINKDAKMTEARIKKYEAEKIRLSNMLKFENPLYLQGVKYIGGIDEVGRGPLAGPVVTCCYTPKKDVLIEGVNDSKKVSEKKREELFDILVENAESYGIGIMNEKVIDDINILNATHKAMLEAIDKSTIYPEHILIDAEHLKTEIPQTAIIKGDMYSYAIACASIVAKVTRDRMMMAYDEIYPQYGFAKNKGYGTKEHIDAILKYGPCPIHRKSFLKNIL